MKSTTTQIDISAKLTTKQIAISAVLIALAVILKVYISWDSPMYRYTFYGIPLVILGMVLGPKIGAMGGYGTDFVSAQMKGWGILPNFHTVASISWAVVPSLVLRGFKRYNIFTIAVAIVITSCIAFIFNSLGILVREDWGSMYAKLPARLITMLVNIVIYTVVVERVYKKVLLPMGLME